MPSTETALRRQLCDALAREAALADRLEALQRANEGAYRAARDASVGLPQQPGGEPSAAHLLLQERTLNGIL